jgi:Uma2 family endonuclease
MIASTTARGADLLRAAPLIIVEVTSRSTASEDWGRKREAYPQGGASWFWIIDPESATVTIMGNEGGHFVVTQRLSEGRHLIEEPFPVALDMSLLMR